MSRSSSPTSSHEDDDAAVLALAGGKVTKAPQIDPSDLEIAVALGRVRGQILAAAKRDGIGVRELARRMKISASAVSRQLSSEGDMRLSTAILLARALGQRWHFSLSPRDAASHTNESSPAKTESSIANKSESMELELPNTFSSNGVSFRTSRTTLYDPMVNAWMVERPTEFRHPFWNIWADDLYLGIIYNVQDGRRVYSVLQLVDETHFCPPFEGMAWPDALEQYLAENDKSESLVIGNPVSHPFRVWMNKQRKSII
jgi:hypothetical protein